MIESSTLCVARGDLFLDDADAPALRSEISGVSDEHWSQFVRHMGNPELLSTVSESNALGMFQLMPRRLADLGIVTNVQRAKSPAGRTIWVAVFVPPMTCAAFLRSPQEQYRAFARSMRDYADRLQSGEVSRGMLSLSGALAVLHRAGPRGLQTWTRGERFPATIAVHERVAGVF